MELVVFEMEKDPGQLVEAHQQEMERVRAMVRVVAMDRHVVRVSEPILAWELGYLGLVEISMQPCASVPH